ncbi:MAG TPA: ADP-ribosylglycohydrolase family protein [Clostridia bacterium]|nr:ADP-ribosylglycohydrolase family protein [Clostridia bacterium]
MRMSTSSELHKRFAGVLLGTAIGDALGLPAEGLSRSRIHLRWHGQWRHRFILGRGMWSDDTEHTLFVAQALLSHPNDPAAFQRCLAWKLRFWLLGLPAGIGFATLRSIIKLWLGFSPSRSGVSSAGNGPAMRSAIIGAYFYDEPERRKMFVSACTRLTHTDPRAETAALAVAEAAACAVAHKTAPADLLSSLQRLGSDPEWSTICTKLQTAHNVGDSVQTFADSIGPTHGVSGYAYHSVPVALYAWFRHPDSFQDALTSALNCGGDTDTVGAIVGALAGAAATPQNISAEWRNGIVEWPRSVRLLTEMAHRLADQKTQGHVAGSVRYFWPGLVLRNLVFLITVLVHGFRRLLP